MLVLSRKEGETIVIGDRIRVTIDRISGGRVRLAVEAPPEVSIDRKEIWLRKKQERSLPAAEAAPWRAAS